jgi:hypothetical protein
MPKIRFIAGSRLVNELDTSDIKAVSFNTHHDSQMAYNYPEKPPMFEVMVMSQGPDYTFFTKSPSESERIYNDIRNAQSEQVDFTVQLDSEVNA